MDDAVASLRAFTRFYTRFAGALDSEYMQSGLSLAEARVFYEIASREAPLASSIQADLGLDAGYLSRLLRRFQTKNWLSRGRGADARQRPIRLTREGKEAFAALDERTRRSVEERLAPLGSTDREALSGSLATVQALLAGAQVPWAIRTFRAGDMGKIAARQAILYSEGYGWDRPMEVLLGEITTGFIRDFKPKREQCG
jgi:DNA-binding MarR family transcriptional regulator